MLNKNKEDNNLKEMREMLKDIKEIMDKLDNTDIEDKKEMITEALINASKEKAKISIEMDGKGGAQCEVEGHRLSLIIALASLEKHILKETNTPKSFFEAIKNVVGSEEDIEVL